MPHQLRRIVTINARNLNGGLPTGRIAELDPRGGVLAVGDNGVGKTTFLRLLPLFYGATPTQVLKGTGRSSMISFTLPDASSAVAYEYERGSATDLRTVVMHACAGEEAPQFHIVMSGYQENFFYDENNQFVSREEFKARVEAMGIEVTRRLSLHEYRAVILKERSPTKKWMELSRLAALHSLGPSPLYNLDQISASMANEKINFRDLQNIVLERVLDTHTAGVKSTSVRELKQNKEAVTRWLEARGHLSEIFERKPEALRIKDRVAKIKGLHLELCSLHVAVKSAIAVVAKEHTQLTAEHEEQSGIFEKQKEALHASIESLKDAKSGAEIAFHAKQTNVENTLGRQKHFERIDAQAMALLEDSEAQLKALKASKDIERYDLTKASGDVTRKRNDRQQVIELEAGRRVAEIDDRSKQFLRGSIASFNALAKAQENALGKLTTPARLAEIAAQRVKNSLTEGELRQKIQNPVASKQTRLEHKAAQDDAHRWAEDLTTAQREVSKAREALEGARAATNQGLSKVGHLEQQAQAIDKEIEQLQSSLTPASGTFLEFIRSSDPALWNDAARLIDPALLARDDLHPTYRSFEALTPDDADDAAEVVRMIAVGPVNINVQHVDCPAWFDMQEVREALERQQGLATQVADALKLANEAARKLNVQLKLADAAHEAAKAHESLINGGLEAARLKKGRLDKVVQEETRAFKEAAQAERSKLQDSANVLDAEELRITKGAQAARQAVLDDFAVQHNALEQAGIDAESRFEAEKQAVQHDTEAALLQLKDDYERDLAGLGLDPRRVSDLDDAIDVARSKLESISSNRHEVSAWRVFCRNTLPSLPSDILERDRLGQRAVDVGKQLGQEQLALDDLIALAKMTLDDISRKMDARKQESQRLQDLVDQYLKDFLDHVPTHLHLDWLVPELEGAIKSRRSSLASESNEIQKETRTLRNEILKRPGGPADWLEHKERDLPDRQRLLEHQYLCAQAEVICDWFEPMECGPYVDQLNKEMQGFFSLAGEFVRVLDQFERRVHSFNSDLNKALADTKRFERFRDLSVTVSSNVGQLGYIKVLRQMQDKAIHNPMAYRSVTRTEKDLPTGEDAALVRTFRDILQNDGAFKVNLNEQVRLECTLYENGQRRTISNEEEFRSVSSNGNSALITAMFLMGFIQMVRGDAPVRLTWVTDEAARFDAANLSAFLQTLDHHRIDVISACPSVDPALARCFKRLCIFEGNGAIFTTEPQLMGIV